MKGLTIREERQADDVWILDLIGKISMGEGAVTLRNTLRRHFEEGHKKILLNFKEVTAIDNAGRSEIQNALRLNTGVEIKTEFATGIKAIEIIGLVTIVDCHDSEAEALYAFG